MKVRISVVIATFMFASLQNGVDAGQSSKPKKSVAKNPPNRSAGQKAMPTTGRVQSGAKPQTPPAKVIDSTINKVRDALIGAGEVLPSYKVMQSSDGSPRELSKLSTELAVFVIYHPASKTATRALLQIVAAATKARPKVKVYALCVRTNEAVWKASIASLPELVTPLWDPAGRSDTGINVRKVLGVDAYPTIIVAGSGGVVRDAFAGWFYGDRRLLPLLTE